VVPTRPKCSNDIIESAVKVMEKNISENMRRKVIDLAHIIIPNIHDVTLTTSPASWKESSGIIGENSTENNLVMMVDLSVYTARAKKAVSGTKNCRQAISSAFISV
jgi:hypothetical protein